MITLHHKMNKLLCKTLAPATTRSYKPAFQKYLRFCQTNNLKALPVIETNLMLFVTNISHTSVSNIKIHISAIKHHATYLIGQYGECYPRLYMLVRAIKRQKKKLHKRIPVTVAELRLVHAYLNSSSLHVCDRTMLWAAVTTAFFGFLRSSEYVSAQTRKYDADTTLCFEDIIYKHPNLHIRIKASKTDPFREGCTICLSPSGADICPVRNLQMYIAQHPIKKGPLFTYADHSLLTQRRLNSLLKSAIPTTSKAPVSSHSLRIGAATTAAAAGLPRWLIQSMGRWSSDCFRTYIQIPASTFTHVSHTLATTIKDGEQFDPDLVA